MSRNFRICGSSSMTSTRTGGTVDVFMAHAAPSTQRVDFTMSKNFRFTESVYLQLRAEMFNIFNHTNFRAISTNITAANFGVVTTTRDPRTMQFGLKLNF